MLEKKNSFSLTSVIPFIAFVTLLISLVYYVNRFSFNEDIDTFSLGAVVWTVVSAAGVVLFLKKGNTKTKLFISAFCYLLYNTFAILATATSLKEFAISIIYNFLWFSLMIVFFCYSKKNRIRKWYKYPIRLLLPVLLYLFIILVNRYQRTTTMSTLNPIFYLLYLVPFAFLEDGFFRYFDLLIIFVAIVLSYKRTALICLFVILLYLFYRIFKETKHNKRRRFAIGITALLFLAGIIVAYFVIVGRYTNVDWSARLEAMFDSGGGRVERWNKFFTDMNESNVLEWIFGHGAVYPYYHNDFMQIIYNSGLIGLLTYVVFCCCLIKKWIDMSRLNYKYTLAFGASMIIFLADSMVGQVVVVHTWVLQLGVVWGILLGDFYAFSQEKRNERCQELRNSF